MEVNYQPLDKRVIVSKDFEPSIKFENIGDEYIFKVEKLNDVISLLELDFDTINQTDNRYLSQMYRISRDNNRWSEWFEFNKYFSDFPPIDPLDSFYVEIKFTRNGINSKKVLELVELELVGELDLETKSDNVVVRSNEQEILKTPYIYKVFKITGLEILSPSELENVDIKYRFSQDNSRTWSKWEKLTQENITTRRFDPLRFFQVEYLITNNSDSTIKISDINLIGDFQNLTLDAQKTNLYGIRECCKTNLNGTFDANGNFIASDNMNNGSGSGGDYCAPNNGVAMTDQEKANLFNPYNTTQATNLLNQLNQGVEQVLGHPVTYFVRDPDTGGQDHFLHEYQLHNISCMGDIKVSVPNNDFPDNQIQFNQFDLGLLNTMEVHISKIQFKEAFGITRQPRKGDFMYFCNLNRMLRVEHAQQFRSFNNTAVYYKLIMKKYNQQADERTENNDIASRLAMLTQNSTIEELFGVENVLDEMAVSSKQQHTILSKEPIRLHTYAKIDREVITNSTVDVAKNVYDLFSVNQGNIAVEYFNLDPILNKSDNIGFTSWFKINNYIPSEQYNIFDHLDNDQGWRIDIMDNLVKVTLNKFEYLFNVELDEEVWYNITLNLDQRNEEAQLFIYKRNCLFEEDAQLLDSSELLLMEHFVFDITPIEYELDDFNPRILGSDMRMTNIRLYTDIIPLEHHNIILNQYIVSEDSKYLVFGDNANNRIYLPNYPLNER